MIDVKRLLYWLTHRAFGGSIATNPTGGTANDTTTFWMNKPCGLYWITATGQLNGQPSQYGQLFHYSLGYGSQEIAQFFRAAPNGKLYYRGSNANTPTMPGWASPLITGGDTMTGTLKFKDNTALPAAGTSTDFVSLGMTGFASGGICKWKSLSEMKTWLGISSSDRRLKSNIEPLSLEDATEFIESLEPCSYDINGEHQIGLIAQDVHEVDPWKTKMAYATDGSDGEGLADWEKMPDGSPTWKLDYERLIPALVAALQDANRRISELERTGQCLTEK